MNVELPEPVALYLSEENADGVDCIERCFTADAEVRDEGQAIRGWEAIRAWKRSAKARYQYRVEPLSAERQGEQLRVHVRTTGNFPGSPVELDYTIVLAGDRIASLEIRG
ncbi:nuclear transport factor 2 family protein [Pseudoxanthomonas putridarboris]|uniref:Nuclear transport factor 2 family protein n=1 Tax=Pseudoxanthomonas putridarboris TaxID=752605 RepID=A0ABU9J6F2_9GAMM